MVEISLACKQLTDNSVSSHNKPDQYQLKYRKLKKLKISCYEQQPDNIP